MWGTCVFVHGHVPVCEYDCVIVRVCTLHGVRTVCVSVCLRVRVYMRVPMPGSRHVTTHRLESEASGSVDN